jgi:hypothetical protein
MFLEGFCFLIDFCEHTWIAPEFLRFLFIEAMQKLKSLKSLNHQFQDSNLPNVWTVDNFICFQEWYIGPDDWYLS